MKIYLVGGAIRDRLLNLPIHEHDWVVVGATVDQMLTEKFTQVGKDFPVFLHPETKEEYALARTERKSGHGYKGFAVHASPEVTLEEDLRRRDLTINAIAESEEGKLIDPFNGQDDLKQGLLRHVSPAFSEDPVRILRIARFAARFAQWGFKVAHETNTLMRKMVAAGEVDYLVPERIWSEWKKSLATDNPEQFFQVLHGCNALAILFPEIDATYPDNETHHTKNLLPKPLSVLQQVTTRCKDTHIRFAALMFALSEYQPHGDKIHPLENLCKRMKVPNQYQRLAQQTVANATNILSNSPESLLQLFSSTRALKQTQLWQQLLTTYLSLDYISPTKSDNLEKLRTEISTVNASHFSDQYITGPDLGKAIKNRQLEIIQTHIATQ